MDLQTAVGVSMLGFSRTRASALFKELRQRDPHASLTCLLHTLGVAARRADEDWQDAARSAAASALASGAAAGMQADRVVRSPISRAVELRGRSAARPVGARDMPTVLARPAVAIVGSRAATTYALDVGGPPGRRACGARHRGRQRAGARRGLGGPPGLPGGWRTDRRGARFRASTRSTRRSTSRWLKPLHPMGLWSASSALAPCRSRSTFPFGTGSSVGSRWPLSSSKLPRRAGPSSPPGAPWNRGATSWRSPAASSPAEIAAPTVF